MMGRSRQNASRLTLLLSAILLAGCGGGPDDAPTVYKVTGKVTKGGKPLADITVSFVPLEGAGLPSSGTTNSEGVYTLKRHTGEEGAIPGSYRVVLTSSQGGAEQAEASYAEPQAGPPQEKDSVIPKKWQASETSPKTVEVKEEDNVIDIDIDEG